MNIVSELRRLPEWITKLPSLEEREKAFRSLKGRRLTKAMLVAYAADATDLSIPDRQALAFQYANTFDHAAKQIHGWFKPRRGDYTVVNDHFMDIVRSSTGSTRALRRAVAQSK